MATIAILDGEGATNAVARRIPEAQSYALPQSSSVAEMLLAVTNNKADIAFVLPSVFVEFEARNPGALHQAEMGEALSTWTLTFGLSVGQHDFKAMIGNQIRQMVANGRIKEIFAEHDPDGLFSYPAMNVARTQ